MAKHRSPRPPQRDRSTRRVASEMRRLAGLGDAPVDLSDAGTRLVRQDFRLDGGQLPASAALVAADAVLERHGETGLRKFFDIRRRRTKTEGADRQRRIATTYERIIPPDERDEDGDYERESGWEDEDGDLIRLDASDIAEGVTIAEKAAAWLKQNYTEASSSEFHPGVWYIGEYDTNYATGVEERHDYHLRGFSPAEERAIYNLMYPRKGKHR